MAVRDQGTASLGKCHFSHLQNLALKLQFKKKKRSQERREVGMRWEEEQHINCFLPGHKATSKITFHVCTLLRVR